MVIGMENWISKLNGSAVVDSERERNDEFIFETILRQI